MATAIEIDVEPLRNIELDMSLDGDPDFDIFEAFEIASGNRGPKIDPYPEFHRRREEQPVYRVPDDEVPAYMNASGDRENYIVYRQEDVCKIAQDSETFSSVHHAEGIGLFFGHSILEMMDEEHTLHRRLIQNAFKRRDLAHCKDNLIPEAVNEMIDAFADRGHANLASELTLLYPVRVIEAMMGLPIEHVEWFHRRAIEVISIQSDTERALLSSQVLKSYFEQVIEIRRKHSGGGDLITLLVEAEVNGKQLRNDEIIPFLMLLAPAGAETTYRATGTLLYAMLANPDQFEAVKKDRSLISKAVEESLRWDPPLTGLGRRTTRDVEFQGVKIPAGSNVNGCLASANRDPTSTSRREPSTSSICFDHANPT